MADNNTDNWLTLDDSIQDDIGEDPELQKKFDEAGKRVQVALKVYHLRNRYNLPRSEFGKIVGMTADQVAKIERINFLEPPDVVMTQIRESLVKWTNCTGSTSEPESVLRLCNMAVSKLNLA